MRARRILLGVVLAMMTAGTAAPQQSWQDHTSAGEWAFKRGDDEVCEAEFRAALEVAQGFPRGDLRLEASLANLGRFYEHRGRWNEAQPLYLLLLAIQEERLGDDDPGLLDALFAVGRSSIPIGDAPAAEESLRRYVAISGDSDAVDPSRVWPAASMLARVLNLQGRRAEALEYQRIAVSAQAEDAFATDLDGATQLETLAQLEITDGEAGSVEALLAEVVRLRGGSDQEGSGAVYAAGAAAALGNGELELAETLAGEAVDMGGGSESMIARSVLADVAWLRVRRGSSELGDLLAVKADPAALEGAAARLEALLTLQDAEFPLDDPERIETLSRLAQVSTMAGDLEAAVRWQDRYAEAVAGVGGDRTLLAQDGLAYLLTETGRFADALEVNSGLLSEAESSWGGGDPRLLTVLRRQELLLAELGRKKEAKAVRKRLKKLGG